MIPTRCEYIMTHDHTRRVHVHASDLLAVDDGKMTGCPGARSTKGRLLVATPPLGDPNFDRSVVYMLEHSDQGAVGVVLNRPRREVDDRGLEEWERSCSARRSRVRRRAGRASTALIALAAADGTRRRGVGPRSTRPGRHRRPVDRRPTRSPPRSTGLRIFRGYAGWGPGSSRPSSAPAPGWSSTPSPTTCSPPTRRTCGATCCAARAAGRRGWPTRPTTSPATDGSPGTVVLVHPARRGARAIRLGR